jgi:hypothetical protein
VVVSVVVSVLWIDECVETEDKIEKNETLGIPSSPGFFPSEGLTYFHITSDLSSLQETETKKFFFDQCLLFFGRMKKIDLLDIFRTEFSWTSN